MFTSHMLQKIIICERYLLRCWPSFVAHSSSCRLCWIAWCTTSMFWGDVAVFALPLVFFFNAVSVSRKLWTHSRMILRVRIAPLRRMLNWRWNFLWVVVTDSASSKNVSMTNTRCCTVHLSIAALEENFETNHAPLLWVQPCYYSSQKCQIMLTPCI